MKLVALKRLSVNLVVLVVSLTLVAVVAEVSLRLFAEPEFELYHQQIFVQYDSLLGWSKIPNKQATHSTTEYVVTERFNSRGIRGPEYSYDKSPDEYRVVFLGDSFVEGYSVNFEELCSEVLSARLSEGEFENNTVINGGTGGWSTDQELLFFQDEARKYQPNLTVLMFFANDLVGNLSDRHYRGYKPLYQMEDGELKLTNVPVPEPAVQRAELTDSEQGLFGRTKLWFYENTRLYRLIRRAVTGNRNLYMLAIKLGLAESPGDNGEALSVPDELKVWARSYGPKTTAAWEITEALIVRLKQASADAKSKLMIFYIPSSAAIYDDHWQATKSRYGMTDSEYNIHQVAIELGAVCERNGIDFINPTEAFKAEAELLAQTGERLYFARDHHWTAAGHRLTAQLLGDYISRTAASGR